MANPLHNATESFIAGLTNQQRHDLKNAVLSVRWAADLLCPADGSQPPCELISNQLYAAFALLEPVIDELISGKGQTSE